MRVLISVLKMIPDSGSPDLIWWDEQSKKTVIVELTICFDTLFGNAAERKRAEYYVTRGAEITK